MTKNKSLRFLCVMDPPKKLDPQWDNSLAVLEELSRRGHETWWADSPDIWASSQSLFALCRKIRSRDKKVFILNQFDLILLRKEPPFDESYLYLTYLLERAADQTPVLNAPGGVRDANEKLSTLNFPRWIPETLVTSSTMRILEFQKSLGSGLIVKPLNQKGGKDIFRLNSGTPQDKARLSRATQKGKKLLIVQRFINTSPKIEKRIVLLDGRIAAIYEKRPRGKEFRGNLGLGATFHRSKVTRQELHLVREITPYLKKKGISLAGLDVLNEKLIEINVTCPAGLTEARFLGVKPDPVGVWASFLEDFPKKRRGSLNPG